MQIKDLDEQFEVGDDEMSRNHGRQLSCSKRALDGSFPLSSRTHFLHPVAKMGIPLLIGFPSMKKVNKETYCAFHWISFIWIV